MNVKIYDSRHLDNRNKKLIKGLPESGPACAAWTAIWPRLLGRVRVDPLDWRRGRLHCRNLSFPQALLFRTLAFHALFPPREVRASSDSSRCSKPESESELCWLPVGSSRALSLMTRLIALVFLGPVVFFSLTMTTYGSSDSSHSSTSLLGSPRWGARDLAVQAKAR